MKAFIIHQKRLQRLCVFLCLGLLSVSGRSGYAQQVDPDGARTYEDVRYVEDQDRITNSLRLGAGASAHYNTGVGSMQTGTLVGGLPTGNVYVYGDNVSGADFKITPGLYGSMDATVGVVRSRLSIGLIDHTFQFSQGHPLAGGPSTTPFYRSSMQAFVASISAGYQKGPLYILADYGYGTYLHSAFGTANSTVVGTPISETSSALVTYGATLGLDILLAPHKWILSPEVFVTANLPSNQPLTNFIPSTISTGIRVNVQKVLFENYEHDELNDKFIYAMGDVRDCRTTAPVSAKIAVWNARTNQPIFNGVTDRRGRYCFRLPKGTPYRFVATSDSYDSSSTSCSASETRDANLSTISLKDKTYGCGGIVITGNVVSCETGKPVPARISIINAVSGKTVSQIQNDAFGRYTSNLPEAGSYRIEVNTEEYLPREEEITISRSNAEVTKTVEVFPKEINICNSIDLLKFFKSDSWTLVADSLALVNRIAAYMVRKPQTRVTIEGHTDITASLDHNMILSRRRAATLSKYLTDHGVHPEQIVSCEGYGPNRPIGDNRTHEGRKANRRVTLTQVSH